MWFWLKLVHFLIPFQDGSASSSVVSVKPVPDSTGTDTILKDADTLDRKHNANDDMGATANSSDADYYGDDDLSTYTGTFADDDTPPSPGAMQPPRTSTPMLISVEADVMDEEDVKVNPRAPEFLPRRRRAVVVFDEFPKKRLRFE